MTNRSDSVQTAESGSHGEGEVFDPAEHRPSGRGLVIVGVLAVLVLGALVVTGVVTRNMAAALRDTWAAVPEPKVVVAVGDCACDGGVFAGAYGVVGPVSSVVPVGVEVRGCPPSPTEIIAGLRTLRGR